MDINQIKYFMAIVENDFNMSKAAQKLHLSQPALSKIISKLENEENLYLFKRSHGRLAGLTSAGESLYGNAGTLVSQYDRMLMELRDHSRSIHGTVRIGIPPLILTVLFTEIMAKLISENPTIHFEVIEQGAFELRRMLLLNELDFAVLISPTGLNPQVYNETILYESELTAFMSKDHALASMEQIRWSDLKALPLAVFNSTFMIHHQLIHKFESLKSVPNIALTSGSWDFLVEVTRSADLITILPSPIRRHVTSPDIKEVSFEQPVLWQVVLNYAIKPYYTQLEEYTRNRFKDYFAKLQEHTAEGRDLNPESVQI